MLLQAGADVNIASEKGFSALMQSALNTSQDFISCLKLLLNQGADVNLVHRNGNTALILAAESANISGVRMLMQYEAHINKKNRFGQHALERHLAQCHYRSKKLAMVLFAAGETIDGTTVKQRRTNGRILRFRSVPKYLQNNEVSLSLSHMCRSVIRKCLPDLNQHANLFQRVLKLNLPPILCEYLVYRISLDDDTSDAKDDDNDDDDDDDDDSE